jgi:hypothetical protein
MEPQVGDSRPYRQIRLHLVGQSLASLPNAPALNTVPLGGADPSRLLIPVTPAQQ